MSDEVKPNAAFRRALEAGKEFFAHGLLVAFVLVVIHLLEWLTHKLSETDPLLFGCTRLSDVFQAADTFVLVGIVLMGVYKVLRTYAGKE